MLTREKIRGEMVSIAYDMNFKGKDYAIAALENAVVEVMLVYNECTINIDLYSQLQRALLKNMLCAAQIMTEYSENSDFRKRLKDIVITSTYKE